MLPFLGMKINLVGEPSHLFEASKMSALQDLDVIRCSFPRRLCEGWLGGKLGGKLGGRVHHNSYSWPMVKVNLGWDPVATHP